MHASSGELPRIFERGEVAIVVDEQRAVIGIVDEDGSDRDARGAESAGAHGFLRGHR